MAGLEAACVEFCRRLRDAGLPVATGSAGELLRAVAVVGPEQRSAFRLVSRALLANDRTQWTIFDAVFDDFWRSTAGNDSGEFMARASSGRDHGNVTDLPVTRSASPLTKQPDYRAATGFGATGEADTPSPDAATMAAASAASWASSGPGQAKATLATGTLLAARDLVDHARRSHPYRRLRRLGTGPAARRANLRRTLRETARYGRVVTPPRLDDLVIEQRHVVVIADASRSMHPYARTVLGVAHLLVEASSKVDAFAFATRLTRITDCLRRPPAEAVDALRRTVPDWGTGTRIGPSLAEFNRRWARRALTSSGLVVLITDGLDAGDITQLKREAIALRQRSWRLVWINPLAGGPGFKPSARGMRALLAAADVLLPCRDKNGVATLLTTLATFRGVRTTDPIVTADRARWAREL